LHSNKGVNAYPPLGGPAFTVRRDELLARLAKQDPPRARLCVEAA
jgi:hypothetical protein